MELQLDFSSLNYLVTSSISAFMIATEHLYLNILSNFVVVDGWKLQLICIVIFTYLLWFFAISCNLLNEILSFCLRSQQQRNLNTASSVNYFRDLCTSTTNTFTYATHLQTIKPSLRGLCIPKLFVCRYVSSSSTHASSSQHNSKSYFVDASSDSYFVDTILN